MQALQGQVRAQAQEILKLRAMFMGVVELLHAKTPFDDAELQASVMKAYTTLTQPKQPTFDLNTAAVAGPGGSAAPTAQAPQQLVQCMKCQRQVPASRTIITANGTVCDACA
jgi:hypothetical protein